ncbi:MAG: hypothetical protein ACU0CA_03830 [Paracoccaceae bacterium]
MGHFSEFDQQSSVTPVAGFGWTTSDLENENVLRTGVRYRKTRSTLALYASDLADLNHDEIADAFKSLLQLSKYLGRDEIVVECLETLAKNGTNNSFDACLNAIQSDIIRVCRKMNLYPPRIALEKRGQHFDLRIYPVFH